jgi:hypothetical protein
MSVAITTTDARGHPQDDTTANHVLSSSTRKLLFVRRLKR